MKKRILTLMADSTLCGLIRLSLPHQYISALSDWEIREAITINQTDTDWLLQGDKKVAIFQRQYGEGIFQYMRELQNRGVTCVYESDDLVTSVQISNPAWSTTYGNPVIQKNIRSFLSATDAVIVSTQGIKDEWLKFNKNIYVIENGLNWKDYPIKADTEFKIILTGSTSHIDDWGAAISALQQIKDPIYTMGFCEALAINRDEEFRKLPKDRDFKYPDNVRPIAWCPYGEYIEKLYDLSGVNTLGLTFISENVFNNGKSNLKMLEFAMTGSVILGNNFGPYEGHHVLYAKNRTSDILRAINKFKAISMEDKYNMVVKQKEHFKKWNLQDLHHQRLSIYNEISGAN